MFKLLLITDPASPCFVHIVLIAIVSCFLGRQTKHCFENSLNLSRGISVFSTWVNWYLLCLSDLRSFLQVPEVRCENEQM